MKKIAVLASGSGTNAENIIRYFKGSSLAQVVLVVADNPKAGVLERARHERVPSIVIPRADFREKGGDVADRLRGEGIDYVVLAGFLSLVPAEVVREFEGRIINIHPALLPAYGGKGMYGDNVHRAVVANGEKQSGITIHLVNEKYDDGAIIAQFRVDVAPGDTPEDVARKVHALEYEHFPRVIEQEIERMK